MESWYNLFDDVRPTPELSFAIRHLGCQGGIVITASHNPKEYNGYKAYWDDGAQLINPHDEAVIEEVRKIASYNMVNSDRNPSLVKTIGEEVDKEYLAYLCSLSLSPEIIRKHKKPENSLYSSAWFWRKACTGRAEGIRV